MSKSATVRARIEPRLKKDAENVFHRLGVSTTEAINIFYTQVKLHRGFPFEVKIPNEKTKHVFKSTDKGEELNECADADELFEKLGI